RRWFSSLSKLVPPNYFTLAFKRLRPELVSQSEPHHPTKNAMPGGRGAAADCKPNRPSDTGP
ncbi:MAG: hypothetical protein ACXW4U_10445, partial [Anaerolineales bacterium]